MRLNSLMAAVVGLAVLVGHVCAEQKAIPMPADNRLVVYPYDANDTYPVLAVPGSATHIELEPGEEIQAFAIGDSIQWKVEKNRNNLFIRALRPGSFTSATMVTNRRTYQLTLRSSPPGGNWYQRVSWQYPDMLVYDSDTTAPRAPTPQPFQPMAPVPMMPGTAAGQPLNARDMPIADLSPGLRPMAPMAGGFDPLENFNFEYRITGEADFKPEQVYDDGTFTFIRLPARTRRIPGLFVKGATDTYDVPNYTIQDKILKAKGVFSAAVLKLGDAEVEISATTPTVTPPKKQSSGFFGLFGGS